MTGAEALLWRNGCLALVMKGRPEPKPEPGPKALYPNLPSALAPAAKPAGG